MRAIELRAGRLFADFGMQDIADHPPPAPATLREYIADGRAWVADVAPASDAPVGFALADVVDGSGHLEQLSVDPAFGRRGLGERLIGEVERWACSRGYPALTLTTFRHVPWNQPYYARLDFVPLASDEVTPGLARLIAEEASHGLDPAQRVVMRRPVNPGGRTSGHPG